MIWGEKPLCLETPIWSPEISSTPKRPKRSFHAQVASPGSLSDSIPDERNEMLELLHHWKIHRLYVSYMCVLHTFFKKKLYECSKTIISVCAHKFCILVSGLIFFCNTNPYTYNIYKYDFYTVDFCR